MIFNQTNVYVPSQGARRMRPNGCCIGLRRFPESESQRVGSFAIFGGRDSGVGSFLKEPQCRDSFQTPWFFPLDPFIDRRNIWYFIRVDSYCCELCYNLSKGAGVSVESGIPTLLMDRNRSRSRNHFLRNRLKPTTPPTEGHGGDVKHVSTKEYKGILYKEGQLAHETYY